MFTHNQAIDLFKQVATKHKQINSMGVGGMDDLAVDVNLLYVGANENKVTFPLLWVVPNNFVIGDTMGAVPQISYDILILDQEYEDMSNEQEILSDTLLIMHDVYALLTDPKFRDHFILERKLNAKPINSTAFDEISVGWQATFTFNLRGERDRCAVPLDSAITITQTTSV